MHTSIDCKFDTSIDCFYANQNVIQSNNWTDNSITFNMLIDLQLIMCLIFSI